MYKPHPGIDPLTTLPTTPPRYPFGHPIGATLVDASRASLFLLGMIFMRSHFLSGTEAPNLLQNYFWERQGYSRRRFCVLGPHWSAAVFCHFWPTQRYAENLETTTVLPRQCPTIPSTISRWNKSVVHSKRVWATASFTLWQQMDMPRGTHGKIRFCQKWPGHLVKSGKNDQSWSAEVGATQILWSMKGHTAYWNRRTGNQYWSKLSDFLRGWTFPCSVSHHCYVYRAIKFYRSTCDAMTIGEMGNSAVR